MLAMLKHNKIPPEQKTPNICFVLCLLSGKGEGWNFIILSVCMIAISLFVICFNQKRFLFKNSFIRKALVVIFSDCELCEIRSSQAYEMLKQRFYNCECCMQCIAVCLKLPF